MCNLYSNRSSQDEMRNLFRIEPAGDRLGNMAAQAAIFPDAEVAIVRQGREGRELVRARWGWSKAKFGWVTNVRNLESWPWKDAIADARHRCLVPATSFAEYHPSETDEKGRKLATWFRLTADAAGEGSRKAVDGSRMAGEGSDEDDRPPFAFAGLVRRWHWERDGLRRKSDQPLADDDVRTLAMAFLTTEANAVVAPIHPKAMPVILRPDDYERWLTGDAADARALQRPLPDEQLEIAFTGAKAD